MNENVTAARAAILLRFVSLDAIAWTSRREVAFVQLVARYRDGYRDALAALIADQCVDRPAFGFLRLTDTGYREAQKLVTPLQ